MALRSIPDDPWLDPTGRATEFRLKAQQLEQDRATQRASELAQQVAPANDAQERIRIWERLHALQLPKLSSHMLVKVIAQQTSLPIGEVHEEQRRRAARNAPALLGASAEADATVDPIASPMPAFAPNR